MTRELKGGDKQVQVNILDIKILSEWRLRDERDKQVQGKILQTETLLKGRDKQVQRKILEMTRLHKG